MANAIFRIELTGANGAAPTTGTPVGPPPLTAPTTGTPVGPPPLTAPTTGTPVGPPPLTATPINQSGRGTGVPAPGAPQLLKSIGDNIAGGGTGLMGMLTGAAGAAGAGGAAGAAGAGAAGALGAAAAAGPAAPLVLAAQMIKAKIVGGIQAGGKMLEFGGQVASKAMSGDNSGAVRQVAGGMVELSKEIPIVGEMLGLLGDVGLKAIDAFSSFTRAAIERGKELSAYNANLAGAGAMADVRSMMGDIREAEALGPALARMTEAQSKADDNLRKLLEPMKKFMIEKGAILLEKVSNIVGSLLEIKLILTSLSEVIIGVALAISSGKLLKIGNTIKRVVAEFKKAWRELKDEKEFGSLPWDKFLDDMRKNAVQPIMVNAPEKMFPPRIEIPILKRN